MWTLSSQEPGDYIEGQNLGVMTGAISGDLVCVDVDDATALGLADEFLPPTLMCEGRPSKPKSHRWYLVKNVPAAMRSTAAENMGGPFTKHLRHTETGKGIIDFQGTGAQACVPPSLHQESGEIRVWHSEGPPAEIDFAELWEAVCKLNEAAGGRLPDVCVRDEDAGEDEGPRAAGDSDDASSSQVPWLDQVPMEERVRQCSSYLRRCDKAKNGHGGSVVTWRVARLITNCFAVDDRDEAEVLLREYNLTLDDKWKESEIQRQLGRSLVRSSTDQYPKGKKLRDPRPAAGPEHTQPERGEAARGGSEATRLVTFALQCGVEPFRDISGTLYASIPEGAHRENWEIASSHLANWIRNKVYLTHKRSPKGAALTDAIETLASRAMFGAPQYDVFRRVAGFDGKIYLDLCDECWRVVEIDAEGWRIIGRSPVRFCRTSQMKLLPDPVHGGSLSQLQCLLNVTDEVSWRHIVAWLLTSLRPDKPYPVLVVHGVQGSAKSWASKFLRSIIDDHTLLARKEPKDPRDLFIAANNNWITAFDNVSTIRPWLSDALCSIANGGGYGTRALYENDEEHVLSVRRPILINGIAKDMVSRPDLLERSLMAEFAYIPDGERRSEAEVDRLAAEARPLILGALLDAVSAGLRNLPNVTLNAKPRLADVAEWVEACSPQLGWAPGAYLDDLLSMREEADDAVLSNCPLSLAFYYLIDDRAGETEMTYGSLLEVLKKRLSEHDKYLPATGPRSPRALSAQLTRFEPSLRRVGVIVTKAGGDRKGHKVKVSWNPDSKAQLGSILGDGVTNKV
jgi:Bifunctional DNA primase/polymerase, N-terminal